MNLPDDKLLELLQQAGLVQPDNLAEIEKFAANAEVPIDQAIVEKGFSTWDKIGQVLAGHFQVPYVDISTLNIPTEVLNLIPERVARKQKVIAFERSNDEVKVAMSDPTNTQLVSNLEKKTGLKIILHFANLPDLLLAMRKYEKDLQRAVEDLLKQDIWKSNSNLIDPPLAKIVDLLIESAYHELASDIHIEPYETQSLIRFRVDGMLHDVLVVPKYIHDRIITRIKVLSGLRTDEHLSAQDGKMRLEMEEENLDIRVSIVPVVTGEKSVLRLLTSHTRKYNFVSLGMNETDLKKVTNAYGRSFGMILSTGPTGSGKTTSIYSILKDLNTREKNITTVEDPVEYRIKGANQIQVNVKTNLTFANGLRSILRQDPNIIFVGEIRDNETAGIAVNAALTGHLVLSTLHTNDAATAIPRLTDMKVEPFLVASTVNVIIAQRLVRMICTQCRTEVAITEEELGRNFPEATIKNVFGTTSKLKIFQGKGCKSCRNTGYLGRIGLFEVLEVTKTLRKLIIQKADVEDIKQAAVKDGMKTMLEDGLDKVKRGLTTLEEILRVTKTESVS